MMEEIDRFQDPTAASISDRDCDTREGETVAMNYKPSPLRVKLEKQRELARKGSLKNGNMGSPVNQQPKKNNVMARTRLVVPNKGYSSLDQSPDEKPLVALDTDSDDDFDMSRYTSSGYSSAEIPLASLKLFPVLLSPAVLAHVMQKHQLVCHGSSATVYLPRTQIKALRMCCDFRFLGGSESPSACLLGTPEIPGRTCRYELLPFQREKAGKLRPVNPSALFLNIFPSSLVN
ncbi:protein FAM219A-like isoform X3 [Rissa tridactyla]|uniref:protein FAM219A-like isoform X3 n=1 Tax=Rissa tridactyla TaxID=75485 RepID=UPI0023BA9902|nr:protein FAM219A-like isoform X3 [Rissa tridactyla]